MNFFDDHTKIILSYYQNDYLVTFIDPERCAKTYSVVHIIQDGCRSEIVERMSFAKTMLKNLVDIEGADIWRMYPTWIPRLWPKPTLQCLFRCLLIGVCNISEINGDIHGPILNSFMQSIKNSSNVWCYSYVTFGRMYGYMMFLFVAMSLSLLSWNKGANYFWCVDEELSFGFPSRTLLLF